MKVQNEMATRIAIDTVGAANSLKGLSNAVLATTNAWKSQEMVLKSTGDGLGAAKAKYEGLGSTIDAQKRKIEELKNRQSGLDVENKKDADTYLKLQKDIDTATRQLNAYESQQDKAKKTLDYYITGLADLKKGYKQSSDLSKSFVDRLQAEGKEEAQKAKISGLKQNLENLSAQYKIQEEELKKVASQSGITSDAYIKQKTRLNETATAIANTRTKVKDLDKAMDKKPKLNLDGVIKSLENLNAKAEDTHHIFGKILGAELISKAAIAGLQSIKIGLIDALKAGMEFNKEQQVMSAAWNTLTGDASKAKDMIKTINTLSVATGRSRDLVNELEQGFYHLHSNKKESDELTKSMLNMGDAVGLTDDQLMSVTQDMVHGLAAGKLSLGELNQLGQYFPMFTEQMAAYVQKHKQATDDTSKDSKSAAKAQKAYVKEMTAQFEAMHYGSQINQQDIKILGDKSILTGEQIKKFHEMQQSGQKITTSMIKQAIRVNSTYAQSVTDSKQKVAQSSDSAVQNLRNLVHQGKVSSEEVEAVFNQLGQDKYGKAADNMLQTMNGMQRTIKAQVPALIGAFEKPIMEAKNPFYDAVSKWVSDKKTQEKFTQMGQAAQKGVDTIINAFSKVFAKGSAVNTANGLLDWITQKITDLSNWIAGHANQIVDFFKKTKDVMVDLFERGKETLGGFYDIAKPFLDLIKKYPKQFGELVGAMYLAKPAITGVSVALKGLEMFKIASGWVGSLATSLASLSKFNLASASGKGLGLAAEAESAGKIAGSLGESASWMAKISKGAGPLAAGIGSILELQGMTKKTTGSHVGGAVGNAGGALTGAAIGSAILPGIGTLAGSIIGAFGGSKIGEKVGEQIQKGLSHSFKSTTPIRDSFKKTYNGLSDDINKQLLKVANSTKGFTSDEKKKIDQLYKDIDKSTNKYFKSKQNQSKKDLDVLVKNHIITKSEEDKKLKAEKALDKKKSANVKAAYQDQQKITDKYYSTRKAKIKEQEIATNNILDGYAKEYGKHSKQYANKKLKLESKNKKELNQLDNDYFTKLEKAQSKTNAVLNDQLQTNSKKQKSILNKLKNDKHKISLQAAAEAIQSDNDLVNRQISIANKGYQSAKKSAEKKYKKVVTAAKKERDESGTISDSQYKKIVTNAEKTKDNSIKAAEKSKDKAIDSAKETHKQVVKHATAQAGEHKGALDKETGYVKGSTQDQMSQQYDAMDAGTDMINWVWGLFSKEKHKFPHANRSAINKHKNGLFNVTHGEIAVVGEEGMELAHHPSKGIYPVGIKGEEVRYLEPNTSILPHEMSKQFLSMAKGLPHYKSGKGNFLDDILDGAKNTISKITNGTRDVWKVISKGTKEAWDFLAKKFSIDRKFTGMQQNGDFGKASGGLIAHEGKSAFTQALKKIIDKAKSFFDADAGGQIGSPSGAGVQRWKDLVKKALEANGLSTSAAMIAKILRQIATESGGNENARQPGADPDGDGSGPALGLMQTKRGTFDAYKFSGHGNIFNGYDNLLAALKYAKARYGNDLSFLGQGHGYANGGFIGTHGLYEIAEGNKREAIIPLDITKRSRANQLLNEVVTQFNNDSPVNRSYNMPHTDNTESINNLSRQFDTLLTMFGQLLGLNSAQLEAIKASSFDKDKLYRQQSLDQAIRDSQAFVGR